VEEDTLKDEEMEYVCGIDVSYVKNTANCSRLLNNEEAFIAGDRGSEHEYSVD
jgi:deoxyinosine 3'endonuclease (endonuclease V)